LKDFLMQLDARAPSGPIEKRWSEARFQSKLVNPANKRKYEIAVVGAPVGFNWFNQPSSIDGAAYVYVKTNGGWVFQQKLEASDGNAQSTGFGNQFGFAVAVAGNTIAVGAPTRRNAGNFGAVYIFKRSDTGTDWTEQAIVTSSTPRPFGMSVALQGGTMVAGALEDHLSGGGTSDTGGTGFGGPTAGSGMTQVLMSWNWGANLATLATASVTGAESVSSLFSASGAGSYVTVVAAFH